MTGTGAYIFPSQVVLDEQLRRDCLESRIMRPLLDLASDTLSTDLRTILAEGTDDEVNDPRVRRPVISLVAVAGYQEEQRLRPFTPTCVAGISLGALSAATAVGWLSLEEMVRVSHLMASIELEEFAGTDQRSVFFYNCDHETAFAALREDGVDDLLHLSVIVSSNQFLAGCRRSDLPRIVPSLARVGALFKVVPYSYPGHCDLMGDVQKRFADAWHPVDPLANLTIPMVGITDCRPYTSAEGVRRILIEQYTTVMDWRGVLTYLEKLELDHCVVLRPADFVLKSISLDPHCGLDARMGGIGSDLG